VHKSELEHIIRAASDITNQYEIVVVGSQSILGSVDAPPLECLRSIEADIFVPGNERLSDLIDGAIGEGSRFHDLYGYYAQGVDKNTSILPSGWENRLVRLQSQSTNGKVGYCLEVTDLFLAKCAANREKDRGFNLALLRHGVVDPEIAISRIPAMPLDADAKERIRSLIRRFQKELSIDPPPAQSVPELVPEAPKNSHEGLAALQDELQKEGFEVREVEDNKRFIGLIKQITSDGFVVQRVTPQAVVIHSLELLHGDYVVGQQATIQYQSGRGFDEIQEQPEEYRAPSGRGRR